MAGDHSKGKDFRLCSFHNRTQPRFWNEVTTRLKHMKRLLDLVHDVNTNPLKWHNRRIEWVEDSSWRQRKDQTQNEWILETRAKINKYVTEGLERVTDSDKKRGEDNVRMVSEFIDQGAGGSANTFSAPPGCFEE